MLAIFILNFLYNLFIVALIAIACIAGLVLATIIVMFLEKKGTWLKCWLKVKLGLAKQVPIMEGLGLTEVYWRRNDEEWVKVPNISHLKKGDVFVMFNPKTNTFEKIPEHDEQVFIVMEPMPKDCEDPHAVVLNAAVVKA